MLKEINKSGFTPTAGNISTNSMTELLKANYTLLSKIAEDIMMGKKNIGIRYALNKIKALFVFTLQQLPFGCLDLGLFTSHLYESFPIQRFRIVFENDTKMVRVLEYTVDDDGEMYDKIHHFANIDDDPRDEAEIQSNIALGAFLKSNLYKYTSSKARSITIPPIAKEHALEDSAEVYYLSGNQINEGLEREAVHKKNFHLFQRLRDNMSRTLEESEDGWIFGMDNKQLLTINTTYHGIRLYILQAHDDGDITCLKRLQCVVDESEKILRVIQHFEMDSDGNQLSDSYGFWDIKRSDYSCKAEAFSNDAMTFMLEFVLKFVIKNNATATEQLDKDDYDDYDEGEMNIFRSLANDYFSTDEQINGALSLREVFKKNYRILYNIVPYMFSGTQEHSLKHNYEDGYWLCVEPVGDGLLSVGIYAVVNGDLVRCPEYFVKIDNHKKMVRVVSHTTDNPFFGTGFINFPFDDITDNLGNGFKRTERYSNDMFTNIITVNKSILTSDNVAKVPFGSDEVEMQ